MVYSNLTYGALTTYEKTYFFKIELNTDVCKLPKLIISEPIKCIDLLEPLFYVLYQRYVFFCFVYLNFYLLVSDTGL
jgi:hypothetical protein